METVGLVIAMGILAISFSVQVRGNNGELLTKLGLKLTIVSVCKVERLQISGDQDANQMISYRCNTGRTIAHRALKILLLFHNYYFITTPCP